MQLKRLLSDVSYKKIIGKEEIEIKSVTCDSSEIVKDSLFICISGDCYDGHCFVREAENYGAKAIVCEREVNTTLTQIIVEDSRVAMSLIAQNFYNNPAKELKMIGVTGTNGKTTTSMIIYEILNYAGINCGVIGTLGAKYNDKVVDCKLTTPDPIILNKILRDMKDENVEVVVMEVSAHASYFEKIKGIDFEVGIFTNLSQDHLDFFGTMENYGNAKEKFFIENNVKYAVINIDDESGQRLSEKFGNVITYGIENPSDIFAIKFNNKGDKTCFVVNLFDQIHDVKINLKGLFNVYNSLAALTAVTLVGVGTQKAVEGIEKVKGVPGRLELVHKKDYSVYVDYAHTPDGLEKTLLALKTLCKGKLICVFGCGGNRDNQKRALMGEISGKLADFTVLTTDNPRFEEPMSIISEIEEGLVKRSKKYVIVQDRAQAIQYAIEKAKKGDVILVSGKGNEKYQDVLGIKKPYNDNDTIMEILSREEK